MLLDQNDSRKRQCYLLFQFSVLKAEKYALRMTKVNTILERVRKCAQS
jgi:hypothetical protein